MNTLLSATLNGDGPQTETVPTAFKDDSITIGRKPLWLGYARLIARQTGVGIEAKDRSGVPSPAAGGEERHHDREAPHGASAPSASSRER